MCQVDLRTAKTLPFEAEVEKRVLYQVWRVGVGSLRGRTRKDIVILDTSLALSRH